MNTWQVQFNPDGNLIIKGAKKASETIDLFGNNQYQYTLCIDRHNLIPLRDCLSGVFPKVKILNKASMEALIKDQFFSSRDISSFRALLQSAEIPFRYHSDVA